MADAYIYAALMLDKFDKQVSEANLTAVINAAQIPVDESRIRSLVAALSGVDIKKVASEKAIIEPKPVEIEVQTDITSTTAPVEPEDPFKLLFG